MEYRRAVVRRPGLVMLVSVMGGLVRYRLVLVQRDLVMVTVPAIVVISAQNPGLWTLPVMLQSLPSAWFAAC